MPTDIQDLEADLLYLRKGAGVTPERVNAAGVLRLVLGGQDLSYADVRERLVSAIRSLHEADAELLMDVFALSPDTGRMGLLRERRAYYGDKVGRKAETVAAREKQAVVNLRNQLLTGWYPASPLGVRVPELHNGIVNESVRITTVVADGYWQETREHYRFLWPCLTRRTTCVSPARSRAALSRSRRSRYGPDASTTPGTTTSTTPGPCAADTSTTCATNSSPTPTTDTPDASARPAALSTNAP